MSVPSTVRSRPSSSSSSSSITRSDNPQDRHNATRRAYRLFLSDGELVIQALLKGSIHRFVYTGEIQAGSIVSVERFEVRTANRSSLPSEGQVLFLAIDDIRSLNLKLKECDRDDTSIIDAERVRKEESENLIKKRKDSSTEGENIRFTQQSKKRQKSIDGGCDEGVSVPYVSPEAPHRLVSAQGEEPIAHGLPLQSLPNESSTSTVQNSKLREPRGAKFSQLTNGTDIAVIASRSSNPVPTTGRGSNHQPTSSSKLLLQPIERPLNLLTLSDLVSPIRPFPRRNYICDVLAVILWISPEIVKRPYMPAKRDLRIIDPTIPHKPFGVSVSVFVNAATFKPTVGTIALFRSLKTHEWEGISLNAYVKDCKGRDWFITDAERLKEYGIVGVQNWWASKAEELIQYVDERIHIK